MICRPVAGLKYPQCGLRSWQVSLRDTGLRSVIPSYKSPARRCSRDRCAILNAAPYQQAIPATTVEDDDLVTTTVQLPPLTEDLAKEVLSNYGFDLIKTKASDVYTEKRASTALLIHPKSVGAEVPVVIFAHGFSQPVQNYTSTLQKLANEVGAAVIAPETSLFQVLGKVAGSGSGLLGELTAKPPTKMQAALIVDVLRSAGYLHKNGVDGAKMGPVMLMGHSMGAGISVATAAMLKNVAGVAAEAPAVKQLMESPVNPDIHMDDDLLGRSYREAVAYFTDRFPDAAKLHLIGGDQDQIVRPLEVAQLFTAARTAVKNGRLKDVTLFTVKGSHIGFEDKVSVEVNNPLLGALFWVINLLLYKVEILKFLLQDYSEQLAASQYVLVGSAKAFLGQETFPANPSPLGVYELSNGVTAVKTRTGYTNSPLGSKEDTIIVSPDEIILPTPSDEEVGTWLPSTAALLGYSGAHALTVAKAVPLILAGTGSEGLAVQGGMAVVALLAAALVYDNAMLASGRFLGQGPLLEALSSYRYVAHSFAVILSLVAAEQAARAGVVFADTLWFKGTLLAVLSLEVSLSFIQSWFLLELKPLWARGVLRYGYKDPSFSQVLPVISSSVFMAILGGAAVSKNPSMSPLLLGSLASLLLGAVPGKVIPGILAGNLGEVLLLASLVTTEAILRSQGL